jgi:hypothetical protein
MTTKSKDEINKPVIGLSRRNWMKLSIVFVLGGLTCFQIFYKKNNNKDKFDDNMPQYDEAIIKGPFSEYRYFEPTEVNLNNCQANLRTIQISGIRFTEGNCDTINMTISFIGEKSHKRRYFVALSCYDVTGTVIGNIRDTFKDQRTFLDNPKIENHGMWNISDLISNEASLVGSMNEGQHITDIKYIQIGVKTYYVSDEIYDD